ncbi:MAG: MFS transporter [Rhodospirillaceae bacterium]|nr:MFS transporter [Rhodospirillaceae bacterium]
MTNTDTWSEFKHDGGVVAAAMVGIMASCITLVNYSIGVFVIPLSTEFGWSRQEILLATSFVTGGALFTSFIIGWLADRIDLGRLVIGSQLGFGLAFCALGLFVQGLTMFYGIYLSMAFLAGGTLPITFTKIVAAKFVRRRGLAIGLTLSGTGLAGLVVPPYVGYFVNAYGWRVGFFAVATLPLFAAMPLAIAFLRRAVPHAADSATPSPVNYGMSFGEALRSWRFWMLAVAFFLASGASTGMSTNLVPLLIERGYAAPTAANMAAVFGFAVICGRIIMGSLADRFWAPPLAMAFLAPAAVATYLISVGHYDINIALLMIAIVGLATGAEGDLLSYIVTRYFGIRAYGKIFAGIFVAFISAIAISAPLFGYAYDVYKSYGVAMTIAAVAWFVCGLMFLTLGPYPVWQADKPSSA